jgi:hypothetical protein
MQNFCNSLRRHLKVKTLRQISAAAVLSLTLAVYGHAGQVETPGAVAPPPTPPASMTTTDTETESISVEEAILLTVIDLIFR